MPLHFFWNTLHWVLYSVYFIFSFEILRNILLSISRNNISTFYDLLYFYGIVSIIFICSRFMLSKTWWNPIMHDGIRIYYKKFLQKLITADGNNVEKIWTGRFISILTKWTHDWLDAVNDITDEGAWCILTLLYAIFFIFRIDILLWISSIFLIIVSVWFSFWINNWMRKKRFKRQAAHKEWDHQAIVAIMSKNELLQSNGLPNILKKIDKHFIDAKNYQYPVVFWIHLMEEFPRFLFLILRISLYIYIMNSITKWWGSTFSDFAMFITVITFTEKVLNEFLRTIRQVTRSFSSIELLWSTFDSLTPIKGYSTWLPFSPKPIDLQIQNISYGYNETKVFDNFSLHIAHGKKTALVGASGWGKTTLMKLIAGYLHPESGSISVMWNILSDTALKTYYPHIGYLTQEPWVFDATIRENLLSAVSTVSSVLLSSRRDPFQNQVWEKDDQNLLSAWERDSSFRRNDKKEQESKDTTDTVLEQQLISALKLAQCDFVFELEKWLDTEIWERWVRLSGGQKQRLAIAKIFLKNPEIILLDEPTSALDSFSEEKITEALNTLFEWRTVIIVAHRLQTVKKADDIIVIEWWKVVERGTHDSLVKEWWIYNKMLELQSGF